MADAPPIDNAIFIELQESAGADFVAVAFRRAAHSLKSNANTFGATGLGMLARDLELKGVPVGGGDAELDALAREYERVSARLQELRRA